MDDNCSRIYTNKFSVSIGQSDASLAFSWVVPKFNEKNEIIGDKVIDATIVSMTKESLLQMRDILNELCEKVVEDGKTE